MRRFHCQSNAPCSATNGLLICGCSAHFYWIDTPLLPSPPQRGTTLSCKTCLCIYIYVHTHTHSAHTDTHTHTQVSLERHTQTQRERERKGGQAFLATGSARPSPSKPSNQKPAALVNRPALSGSTLGALERRCRSPRFVGY